LLLIHSRLELVYSFPKLGDKPSKMELRSLRDDYDGMHSGVALKSQLLTETGYVWFDCIVDEIS
jgi:hypothetical protein